MRRSWWIAGLLLLLVTAAFALPASAGILTSGSYTYVLNSRTVELPVDILTVRKETLVPTDLLMLFGVKPVSESGTIRLVRGPVQIDLTVGSDTVKINGRSQVVKVAPMSIHDRLFFPSELLPHLGITLEVDGKFVLLEDYGKAAIPAEATAEPGTFQKRLESRTWQGFVRQDSQVSAATITVLTPDLLADPALDLPWGTRQRALSLIEQRTLLMVTLKNQSLKAMLLDPAKLMLVDPNGRQYDHLGPELPVNGNISSLIAPGATRTAILTYAKVDTPWISLYHDASGSVLGQVLAK